MQTTKLLVSNSHPGLKLVPTDSSWWFCPSIMHHDVVIEGSLNGYSWGFPRLLVIDVNGIIIFCTVIQNPPNDKVWSEVQRILSCLTLIFVMVESKQPSRHILTRFRITFAWTAFRVSVSAGNHHGVLPSIAIASTVLTTNNATVEISFDFNCSSSSNVTRISSCRVLLFQHCKYAYKALFNQWL